MRSTDKTVRRSDSAEKRGRKKFFELAKCFRDTTDPKETKRLGDELGRLVFGAKGNNEKCQPDREEKTN